MLTKTEISDASPVLDDTDLEMWAALVRSLPDYQMNKERYPNLESRLEDASETVKGRMLNAILDKIEALGVGVVQLRGGDDGLYYSQEAERNALIRYGLGVLYDIGLSTTVISVTLTEGQYISGVGVGQRDNYHANCPVCSQTHYGRYCTNGFIFPGGKLTGI